MFSLFSAVPTTLAKDSLNDIEKERKQVDEKKSDVEKEIENIINEMETLNDEITQTEEIIANNAEALKNVESDMGDIEQEIDEIEERIDERMDILKDRAKSYQKQDNNLLLEIIFGDEDLSFTEMISRISMVNKIAEADTDLIEEQEADKALVEKKLKQLKDLQAELKEIEKTNKEEKQVLEKKKKSLGKKENNLKDKLSNLDEKDQKLLEKKDKILLERATEATDQVASKNAKTSKADLKNDNAAFLWPTEGGYVSSGMGERWGKMHKGIDIARTDHSTSPPIYAVDDGIVETAGFNAGGYGNQVVIDHGNGIKVRYAHMSSLTVKTGQSVARGDQIGVMGATGNSTGIHLHLEVMKNGGLQNPLN